MWSHSGSALDLVWNGQGALSTRNMVRLWVCRDLVGNIQLSTISAEYGLPLGLHWIRGPIWDSACNF